MSRSAHEILKAAIMNIIIYTMIGMLLLWKSCQLCLEVRAKFWRPWLRISSTFRCQLWWGFMMIRILLWKSWTAAMMFRFQSDPIQFSYRIFPRYRYAPADGLPSNYFILESIIDSNMKKLKTLHVAASCTLQNNSFILESIIDSNMKKPIFVLL